MRELKDLLIYYNNNDVIPFLKARDRQVAYYRDINLDMLKDAPTLPGLALKFGMQGLHGVFHTFHTSQAELAHMVSNSIVGGPSIVLSLCRSWCDNDTDHLLRTRRHIMPIYYRPGCERIISVVHGPRSACGTLHSTQRTGLPSNRVC